MNQLLSDWKLFLGLIGGTLAAILLIAYAFMRPDVDLEQAERKRRLHLNQIGRIAEGQIVELMENAPASPAEKRRLFAARPQPLADKKTRHLVSYSYAISGVTYHTAQDITGLESQVRFERLAAGQPASVKYDAANPSDSILVADDWSGVR